MSSERSSRYSTFLASAGSKKLGQPQPDSNFAEDVKSSAPQQTQW